jgi:hypothetical protein
MGWRLRTSFGDEVIVVRELEAWGREEAQRIPALFVRRELRRWLLGLSAGDRRQLLEMHGEVRSESGRWSLAPSPTELAAWVLPGLEDAFEWGRLAAFTVPKPRIVADFRPEEPVPAATPPDVSEAPTETGDLTVMVTDSTTGGPPIANARVSVNGPSPQAATTNDRGIATFPGLPVGSYTITCDHDGFTTGSSTAMVRANTSASATVPLTSMTGDLAVTLWIKMMAMDSINSRRFAARATRALRWSAVVAIAGWAGAHMAEADTTQEEAKRLMDALEAYSLNPAWGESEFKGIGTAAKDLVAARVARTFDPPPAGRVLARLWYARTETNRSDVATAYMANVRSPDADARKASFFGLQRLGYPEMSDLALQALHDPDDGVLAGALQVLVEPAKGDPRLHALLSAVWAAHHGRPEFYMSNALLEGHGYGHAAHP